MQESSFALPVVAEGCMQGAGTGCACPRELLQMGGARAVIFGNVDLVIASLE